MFAAARHNKFTMKSLKTKKSVYRAFGLNIDSEIPFLDMPRVEGHPDVVVQHGKVPSEIPKRRLKEFGIRPGPEHFC